MQTEERKKGRPGNEASHYTCTHSIASVLTVLTNPGVLYVTLAQALKTIPAMIIAQISCVIQSKLSYNYNPSLQIVLQIQKLLYKSSSSVTNPEIILQIHKLFYITSAQAFAKQLLKL